jgi:hypothetical protein
VDKVDYGGVKVLSVRHGLEEIGAAYGASLSCSN